MNIENNLNKFRARKFGVEIELIGSNNSGSPTMPLETAYLLDYIRLALRHDDIKTAAKHATVFEIKKIA